MKTVFYLITFLLASYLSFAQNSVLPFNGAKVSFAGITSSSIEVSVDDYLLTSNAVPLNKEIKFKFQLPSGFTKDAAQKTYPAAKVTITNAAGQLLGRTDDAFLANATTGYVPAKFKELIVTTGLSASVVKNNKDLIITIDLTDRKSKNTLKLTMPVQIATATQGLKASAGVVKTKTNNGSDFLSSNMKVGSCIITLDEKITIDPTLSYASIEMATFTGIASEEITGGMESYFVYDAITLAPVANPGKLLKRIKMSLEGGVNNYLVKIPYKKKTDTKKYVVRFRWESKDGKKIIESVSTY